MNKMLFMRSYINTVRRNLCTPTSGSTSGSGPNMAPRYRPSEFQKFILVWTKKFKTKAEIPTFVSPEIIERSRSEARIKISNILMILTAVASFGAVLAGKAAAKRGESVHQMNLDWHKQYREDFKKNNTE